ncbi:MAG: D-alanyl-lipoteichoic acid biosynthesis protein DltD [Peptostreptococcus sp.]|uniref:D-alanyl-lipoteichoic acid biosynthesis protein DltD n=1 Tax=Peptostreptococcus sp. TaxID=1262 RepID=UPI002FCB0E7A
MKKLKYIILPILIGVAFAFGLNQYLNKKNTEMLQTKDLYMMLHDTKSLVKDKGVFANNHLMKNGDIMMLGSSELSHSTKQHPDYYFNTGRTKNKVITVGRAYTQTLQDASIVGSLDNNIPEKKVVLLLSMQWFMDKEGVSSHHFQTRFSPIQFYRFLDNPKISDDVKYRYAKRVDELLKNPGEYRDEALYAKMYLDESAKGNVMRTMFNPYYSVRESMVALKDKGITYKKLDSMYDKTEVNYNIKGKINWEEEMKKAQSDAEKRVGKKAEVLGGNRLYIDKGYYRQYIHNKDDYFKDVYDYVDLTSSREFEDLSIFLDTCRDLGVKPTIVLIPGMNEFYDYTGIDKKDRTEFFDKVRKTIKPYDYNLVDLTKNETRRYYLRDVMHIGTVGWVDLCGQLYNIYER